MNSNRSAKVIEFSDLSGQKIRKDGKPDTYYERPAVRPSLYGWRIGTAFFAIGVGTGAQILSVLIDFAGREADKPLVRIGRYLGLAGVLAGPVLYVIDLHTPRRWFNMLRIFRTTSMMSIGSWALTLLGGLSSLTAFGQFLQDRGHGEFGKQLARWAGIPAALLAVVASLYKGSEIEQTSNPLWASAFPILAPLFVSSDAKSAASALSLAGSFRKKESVWKGLDAVAVLSGALELFFGLKSAGKLKGHLKESDPLRKGSLSAPYGALLGLSILAPLALKLFHAYNPGNMPLSRLGSAAGVLGGLLLPVTLIFAGNQSGRRPAEYFSYARTESPKGEPARKPNLFTANAAAGLAMAGAAALFYGISRVREKT